MVIVKRLFLIAGILLVIGIGVVGTLDLIWTRKASVSSYDARKLPETLGALACDLKAKGQPLPPLITLQELVAGGYLPPGEVPAIRCQQKLKSHAYIQTEFERT